MHSVHRAVLASVLAAASAEAAASCGSAFCLVNTDWSVQGNWTEPGVRFDLRYESIDQDQPRSGTTNVAVGQVPAHHDEVETRNKNLVGTLDWSFAPQWGASLTLPYVDRYHQHIHNHQGEKLLEQWDFRELGDARVVGRYEFMRTVEDPAKPYVAGITLGIKLPTGKHDVTNADGDEAERTLQPGSGTTDAIIGAYWQAALPLEDFSWFAQAQAVLPMNSKDGFKPGNQLRIDGGVRYGFLRDGAAMLQLNYVAKGRDSGVNAEPEDSGQRMLYASPGVSWNLGKNSQVYAFAQLPLYQSVNGVQLVARYSFVAGVSSRF
jgi:hypothetical protein